MEGFIFGGNTGIESPQELAKKRELVRALQTRAVSANPRTFGEGLSAIGQALAGRMSDKAIGKREETERQRVSGIYSNDVVPLLSGGGYAPSQPAFRPQSPVTTAPLPSEAEQIGNDAMAAIGRVPNNPTMPVQASAQPDNWDAIRNGIFAGESGGDYNALFGYENRPGGKFANVQLTDMTVNDAIEFSRPQGEYGQSVKAKIGRVATPMGAYQIVGTTLRAAKEGLGLTGNEQMTPELQDALGQWIYKQQGTGAWEGYKGPQQNAPSGGGGYAPQQGGQRRIDPQMIAQLSELVSNPYLPEGQRAIVQQLLGNQMAQMDPMRQMELERGRLEIEQLRNNPNGEAPSSVQELQWRAQQAGLQPGTPEYQAFILNGGGDPATFRALEMQALAAGHQPGTPGYQDFMATRGAGDQAYARVTGENTADVATGGAAAAAVAQGAAEGKASAESSSELLEMQRNMPGLLEVAKQLDELAGRATYTMGGRIFDEGRKQLGLDPSDAAIARAEYIAVVDNQVLPLLRQTFGAAFTAKEGDTLRATLGDPDKSPEEKRAVLNAFIAQKQRDLEARVAEKPAVAAPQANTYTNKETFLSDPDVAKAAADAGVTVEEMWNVLNGGQP